MATATRTAKQLVKTYQSVLNVRQKTQDKLSALLSSQAFYAVMEHDESHPYYALAASGERLVDDFEKLFGELSGLTVSNGTISEELDKTKATLALAHKPQDVYVEALCSLPKANIRNVKALTIAEQTLAVYSGAMFLWSFGDAKAMKDAVINIHGQKLAKRNMEVPVLNINAELRIAKNEVKKLAKMLMELEVKSKNVRFELEKQQTMNALVSGASNSYAKSMLAL